MENIYYELFKLAILGSILWFCYFWLYKDYAVDKFRQDMFELRDQLFDDAANGFIDFDHPAYGLLRQTMNGFIRFGHKVNLPEALVLMFWTRKDKKILEDSFKKRLEIRTSGLTIEKKEKIEEYRSKIYMLATRHLIMSSPIVVFVCALLVVIVAVPIFLTISSLSNMKKRLCGLLDMQIDTLESTAMAMGK